MNALLQLAALAGAATTAAAGKSFMEAMQIPGMPVKMPTVREEACRFCYRQCPISCFVGTCGLEYGFSVRRYQSTNQCYSCDASSSVGINKAGDFTLCSASEAAATSTYVKKTDAGPQGPGVPGNARHAAQEASDAANAAVKNAQLAAMKADESAMNAAAQWRSASANSGSAGDEEQMAEAHRVAMQIRAEELRKASDAAHMAVKIADEKYKVELFKLRKQQIATDSAEEVVERAEKASGDARAQYTKAAADAAEAAREGALAGAQAAGRAAEQAEADELAQAARAAQRRAIIAAKAAKDAADKANIAANIAEVAPQVAPTAPPCNPNLRPTGAALLQAGDAPCLLTQPVTQASIMPVGVSQNGQGGVHQEAPSAFALPGDNQAPTAAAVAGPLDTTSINADSTLPAGEGDDAILNKDNTINVQNLMLKEIGEKLSENPNAVNDPNVFAVQNAPLTQGADGTTEILDPRVASMEQGGFGGGMAGYALQQTGSSQPGAQMQETMRELHRLRLA